MTWATKAACELSTRCEFAPWLAKRHKIIPATIDGKPTGRWTRVLT